MTGAVLAAQQQAGPLRQAQGRLSPARGREEGRRAAPG